MATKRIKEMTEQTTPNDTDVMIIEDTLTKKITFLNIFNRIKAKLGCIDGIAFSDSTDITRFGTCSTAAGTAAKTVTISGFKLVMGARVTIKFSNAITVANATMNISGTGAITMTDGGLPLEANRVGAGTVLELLYDGTNFVVMNDTDSGWRTDFEYASNFGSYADTNDSQAKFRRRGKTVELRGKMKNVAAFTTGTTYFLMATLPAGFRPASEIIYVQQGSIANKFIVRISAEGAVYMSRYGTTDTSASVNAGTWINICYSYLVD